MYKRRVHLRCRMFQPPVMRLPAHLPGWPRDHTWLLAPWLWSHLLASKGFLKTYVKFGWRFHHLKKRTLRFKSSCLLALTLVHSCCCQEERKIRYPCLFDNHFANLWSCPTNMEEKIWIVSMDYFIFDDIACFNMFHMSHVHTSYGSGSKPCTPVVHIKIAGIYGCSSL